MDYSIVFFGKPFEFEAYEIHAINDHEINIINLKNMRTNIEPSVKAIKSSDRIFRRFYLNNFWYIQVYDLANAHVPGRAGIEIGIAYKSKKYIKFSKKNIDCLVKDFKKFKGFSLDEKGAFINKNLDSIISLFVENNRFTRNNLEFDNDFNNNKLIKDKILLFSKDFSYNLKTIESLLKYVREVYISEELDIYQNVQNILAVNDFEVKGNIHTIYENELTTISDKYEEKNTKKQENVSIPINVTASTTDEVNQPTVSRNSATSEQLITLLQDEGRKLKKHYNDEYTEHFETKEKLKKAKSSLVMIYFVIIVLFLFCFICFWWNLTSNDTTQTDDYPLITKDISSDSRLKNICDTLLTNIELYYNKNNSPDSSRYREAIMRDFKRVGIHNTTSTFIMQRIDSSKVKINRVSK